MIVAPGPARSARPAERNADPVARFVALLRGVNVGKGNRVPMATLRELIESLGGTAVSTLLNSGNAVFSHAKAAPAPHAAALRQALREQLDIDVPVIVKSSRQLQALISGNPLAAGADPSRLLVVMAQAPGSISALSALAPLVTADERFHLGPDAAYLLCNGGILQSKAATALLGKLGQACTTRNWATVCKLGALLAAPIEHS